MKKYINSIKNNKGFSSDVILYIIGIPLVIGYFLWPTIVEKTAKPKFYNLKEFTEKVASSVNNYYFTHNKYPDKISELDVNLEAGFEDSYSLIGKGPDKIWCFIPKYDEPISCTQKILGGRIGFFANIKDISAKCITFNNLKKDELNNRLCKQEFKDYNPILMYCENYSYVLNRGIMIKNVLPPNCKELLNKNKI